MPPTGWTTEATTAMNDREMLDILDRYARSLRHRMFDVTDKKSHSNIVVRTMGRVQDRMVHVVVRMADGGYNYMDTFRQSQTGGGSTEGGQ
jgi:hypothetical protein